MTLLAMRPGQGSELATMVGEAVARCTPAGATVLVVSKGDEDLLRLAGRSAWHFPRDPKGVYAGYHPLDSQAAISHLEELRAAGASYLVLPEPAFWWLRYYVGLRYHLDARYRRVWSDESCMIYRLSAPDRLASWLQGLQRRISRAHPLASATSPVQPQAPTGGGPAGHLRFAVDHPETLPLAPPTTRFDSSRMRLHWVIPDFTQGMGGPMAIFRFVKLLEEFGHESTLWIREGTRHGSAENARRVIREHFSPVNAAVRILRDEVDEIEGDAVIATHCWTAYPVRSVTRVRERFYFVQDFEPAFFPVGAEHLLAEATYRFGFTCIASSRWLQGLLRSRYSARAERFSYAYDPAVYHEAPAAPREEERIAFYARGGTPRRAVELGFLALELLAKKRPSMVVDFFGGAVGRIAVPYRYHDHGVLDDAKLAALYRRATVGVVFSTTNHSLIPHEMMGCGLPVVDLEGESTAEDFPRDAISLADPSPEAIAASIDRLLGDARLRERQAARARGHVRELSWESSARQIESALVRGIRSRSRVEVRTGCAPGASDVPMAFAGPVVFAGQPEYYRSCHHDATAGGEHFEFPFSSADPSALRALPAFARERGARTCIVFRPEWLAPYPEVFEALKSDGVGMIGYSTEPIPQTGEHAHPDQLRRLTELRRALSLPYDLVIHYDPSSLDLLARLGFGPAIAHPLPVSRRLFYPEKVRADFDVCFLGRSTPHREAMLAPLKMRFDTVHVAHGLRDEDARALMNRSKLVLNIHNHDYPNFENRVVQALFCGRPVLSEPLSGGLLVAGRDYLPFHSPVDLTEKVARLLEGGSWSPAPIDHARFTVETLLRRLGVEG
jgi:glycosyltransferase involved in cell wall biosynthesis